MKILFVHQNFPAQFKHLVPALYQAGHEVSVLTAQTNKNIQLTYPFAQIYTYLAQRGSTPHIHPWVINYETQIIRGQSAYMRGCELKEAGYIPDVIVAHPGWGESLFLKLLWPDAKLGLYCEFFYGNKGSDTDFDAEFSSQDHECRTFVNNTNQIMHFSQVEYAISPTHWQAAQYPEPFREKISVIHDGINTDFLCPNPNVSIQLNQEMVLTKDSEVITFVNRELEPYRGYHIFMRALPRLLQMRPNAQILIVGGDGVCYGNAPDQHKTWKEIFYEENISHLPIEQKKRVYFLGKIPYAQFVSLLQISTVHVYLTYPFILSWSLLEAMSLGCAIVASNTAPVSEVITHNETGKLIDFFDVDGLVEQVCYLLNHPEERVQLASRAREFVIKNYDLNTVCLPAQLSWIEKLAGSLP